MHVDSSVYITITQGISRGYLPYHDFVDNKGPLMYLLGLPGFMLGGFTGTWITELILMCIAVFFAYKIALFFADKYKALPAVACTFAAARAFFTVSAGTEEYSLPFLMIALYIFTKYYFSPKRDISIPSLIVLGICFASAVLIRLNMFPLWAGFCAIIFLELILKRRIASLGKYVLGFCAGILVVLLPAFLYLNLNGITEDFLHQVVFGGASRGFGGASIKQTMKIFYVVLNRAYSFVPLFWGLFSMIKNCKQKDFLFCTGYTFSYILAVLFLSFSDGGDHYNLTLIPFFVPPIAVFVQSIYSAFSFFSTKAKRNLAITLFLCAVFFQQILKYFDDFAGGFSDHSGEQLVHIGKIIDENTSADDKIISLGINACIYPFTQRDAASRYIYQGSGVDHLSNARQEFLSDTLKNKPAIIAIFADDDNGTYDYLPDWYAPVFELIENEYRLLSDENACFLYVRN
ncbi:MAG: hypothetical protein LBV68_02935 [Spirochaetaceae bacterium]|jgi:hypothetical protein|nr:hypothetical protein [Spirochaetaceae bacterium]